MSYKKSLYLQFFIAIVIAGVITTGLLYQLYAHREKAVIQTEATLRLNQTVHYVDQHLDLMRTIGSVIWISERVQSLKYSDPEDAGFFAYMDLQDYIRDLALSVNSIQSIHVYFSRSDVLVTSDNGVFYRTNEEVQNYYEECMDTAIKEPWITDYSEIDIPYVPKESDGVSYMCPIFSTESNQRVGLVSIQVSKSAILDLIEDADNEAAFYVLDKTGEMILGGKNGKIGFDILEEKGICENALTSKEGSGSFRYEHRNYTYVFSTSTYNDWIYITGYQENLPLIFNHAVVICLICILAIYAIIFLIIVWISGKEVGEPVDELTYAMKQVQNGNFDYRIEKERNDEMGYIYGRFNYMMQHIQALVDEVVKERLTNLDVKYKLLYTQINPHFIFNIFNNMIWLLQQGKYEDLESMMEATAGYYKTSLNFGSRVINVADVESQLNWYATIQKLRFGDLFDCSVEFDTEILAYTMPNLLIQPLLENAINHGASDKEGTTFISVTGKRTGEYMEFKVLDDGVGIMPEQLELIREAIRKEDYEGKDFFALSNIARRIALYYKKDASLTIESEYGMWTEVTLKIPLENEKGSERGINV